MSKNLLSERTEALRCALKNTPVDFQVYSYAELGSTMDEASSLLQQGAGLSGMLVDCVQQTAGRGRQGRVWSSSAGNLAFTLVLPLKRLQALTPLVVSCAIHQALQDITGKKFIIKWPNDILSEDQRKICGVLIERKRLGATHYDLIGIGLNILSAPIPESSCSLRDLNIEIKDSIAVEASIVSCLLEFMVRFELEGFEGFKEYWLENTFRLGTQISFKINGKAVSGQFQGLSSQGELLMRTSEGEVVSFFSGDIVLMQH